MLFVGPSTRLRRIAGGARGRRPAELPSTGSAPAADERPRGGWLFHRPVVVVFPDDDGSIRTRTLDEFVARQENYFATGRKISERLANVQIDMGRRIARVSADFIFMDEGEERPGKLGCTWQKGRTAGRSWRYYSLTTWSEEELPL